MRFLSLALSIPEPLVVGSCEAKLGETLSDDSQPESIAE